MNKAGTIARLSLLLLLHQPVFSQAVSFSHLNTSNGLSDNFIQSLVIDKKGFLWIGTSDGLNIYDGYTISSLFKSSQPGLPSDTIRQLYCDSRDRIWVIAPWGVAWIDEKKIFHQVLLPGKNSRFNCYTAFETTSNGIVLFTAEGHFYFNESKKQWEKIEWLSRIIDNKEFNTAVSFTKDRGIYVYEQRVVIIDFKTRNNI